MVNPVENNTRTSPECNNDREASEKICTQCAQVSTIEAQRLTMVLDDNTRMRTAGCKLAEAALRVAREYDGVHRLLLAVSEWSTAVADEGDRGR